MLNYIWAGLIILSMVFALVSDFRDVATDRYRNGDPLPVTLEVEDPSRSDARRFPVQVRVDSAAYASFYGVDAAPPPALAGYVVRSTDGAEVRFAEDVALPEPWQTIRSSTATRENHLIASLGPLGVETASLIPTTATFRTVRFVKLNAIAQAALDFAETAVTIALSLIGVLALWLGLLRIAEASGLISTFVRIIQPVLRPLFPEIPKDHPALAMIGLNLTANMLGLGNAATPLGIKAMEEMQKLNPKKDTTTNSMVTFLALNTGSVQLVPPSLLVAVMGLQINQLIFSIILATLISTAMGVAAALLLQRLPRYRATDPMRAEADPTAEA